jgi:hypothetical protein
VSNAAAAKYMTVTSTHVIAVIVQTSLWKLINTVIIGGITPALGASKHTLSLVIC